MPLVDKYHTWVDGAVPAGMVNADRLNHMFDDLYNLVNGNLDYLNFASPFTMPNNIEITGGAVLKFVETGGGTDYIGLKAPSSISSSFTLTLPSTAGTSGYMLRTNGSNTLSWVNPWEVPYASTLKFADNDDTHYVALRAPWTLSSNYTYTLPGDYGTSGYVLMTDGSGGLSWANRSQVEPYEIHYNIQLDGPKEFRFMDPIAGNNYIAFRAPASILSNTVWTLPDDDGTTGQCMVTNGSGTLSWSTPGGGGVSDHGALTGLGDDDHTQYTRYAFKTLVVSGQSDVVAEAREDTLTLIAGSGMTITTNATNDSVTFTTSSVSDHGALTGLGDDDHTQYSLYAFKTIAVSGQSNVVADARDDTLTFIAGTDITITTNATNDSVTIASNSTLPSGVICMWHGLIANIPSGWYLCNGSNGTPDLRSKFVKGAAAGVEAGGTGGANTHTHDNHASANFTHSGCSVAAHTITNNHSGGAVSAHSTSATSVCTETPTTSVITAVNAHTFTQPSAHSLSAHSVTQATGHGAQSHSTEDNIPVYYDILFIMKA